MLHLYNTYTGNLFCQGQYWAPGLDIMLLKQQHFSVSGQAAYLARQHPPVEYVYRCSHPLLQFLPQKSLAEWIANNYAAERDDDYDVVESRFDPDTADRMWFVRPQLFFHSTLRPIGAAAGRFNRSDEDIPLDLVFFSPFEELRLRTAGIMESKGIHRVYEPSPVPTLYVGRVEDFLGRVPLIPCFLDGNATSTIPHKYSGRQLDAFECCCADSADPTTWRGSYVYEINTWLWNFGRPQPRLGGRPLSGQD
jgi:hypothetical protein